MNTVIFRTVAPYLTSLMVLFSVFVLLRGHNEPGGGFIGGLIAASAFAIYGIACGVAPVRRAIYFHPMPISGFGLFMAGLAGIPSLVADVPFLTGLWWFPSFGGIELALSTTLVFDIGVYFVVVGAITSIALALEEREIDGWRLPFSRDGTHGAGTGVLGCRLFHGGRLPAAVASHHPHAARRGDARQRDQSADFHRRAHHQGNAAHSQ